MRFLLFAIRRARSERCQTLADRVSRLVHAAHNLHPGDTVDALVAQDWAAATARLMEQLRKYYGLDATGGRSGLFAI